MPSTILFQILLQNLTPPSFPFRENQMRASIGSVATLPQNLRFRPAAGAEIFSCWEYPKPTLDCFANNTLKLDVSTRYLQKIVERFQVAWYDKDAMKQKEVVSNDKTQRSAAPCKASGLRRLHGVKIVA